MVIIEAKRNNWKIGFIKIIIDARADNLKIKYICDVTETYSFLANLFTGDLLYLSRNNFIPSTA